MFPPLESKMSLVLLGQSIKLSQVPAILSQKQSGGQARVGKGLGILGLSVRVQLVQ
jgi:hypothetical protein